jgi:hypothetical protein
VFFERTSAEVDGAVVVADAGGVVGDRGAMRFT